MNASKVSLELIKSWEKCKLKAYPDPYSPLAIAIRKGKPTEGLSGNPWTVGWGQTGKDVEEGTVWTQEKADAALVETVKAHASSLSKALTGPATQPQFDAMVSLSYNIGKTAIANSTVLRKHNAGAIKDAAAAFTMWNKVTVNGVLTYSEGLNNRRQTEKALYLSITTPKLEGK